ncbi:hypothetical protein [Flavisphingomonas formosensis]|uniref:hypothetical protein n=1 Tax=Flavisphingomonas formosensis TaxID=861534 RepID=UPI0018DF5F51|nr:hypothetical protein [Sphingomonas formosensis]
MTSPALPAFDLPENWEIVEGNMSFSSFRLRDSASRNVLEVCGEIDPHGSPATIDAGRFAADAAVAFGGRIREITRVTTPYGKLGSAIFDLRDLAYAQLWCLHGATARIQASYFCNGTPSGQELAEVRGIVRSLRIDGGPEATPKKRWWPFGR